MKMMATKLFSLEIFLIVIPKKKPINFIVNEIHSKKTSLIINNITY